MGDLIDLVYEVAYFWRLSPLDLLERSLREVFEMKAQQNRIAVLIEDEINRQRKA